MSRHVFVLVIAGCAGKGLDTGADMAAAPPDLAVPAPDLARSAFLPNLCREPRPEGAPAAPPAPKYAGKCPKLATGDNTIMSSGAKRAFMVAVPKDLKKEEQLPVLFLWHWLGGSAKSFYEKGEIQAAADGQRFLGILPTAKGDVQFKWPATTIDSQARMEEDFRFFDDLLACAAEQFNLNLDCVASAGVSAGALFTDQLAAARSDRLASAVSLSGGTGGFAKPWGNPPRKLPMLVLWGGPTDNCLGLVSFEAASMNLEMALGQDHFLVECVHNCGHSEPPIDAPMGLSRYASLWQFVFDHPFWIQPGDSPYLKTGLPSVYPPWCTVGKGAVPRTGECPNKPGC